MHDNQILDRLTTIQNLMESQGTTKETITPQALTTLRAETKELVDYVKNQLEQYRQPYLLNHGIPNNKGIDKAYIIDRAHRAIEMLTYLTQYASSEIADDGQFTISKIAFYEQLYYEFISKLRTLDPITQHVFNLHRYEGLSFEQIASSLAISEKEARKRLEQALGIFSKYYKEALYD